MRPAEQHARTMLAWHRDSRRTAVVMIIIFGLVTVIDGSMYLATGALPFAFVTVFAFVLALAGLGLGLRHDACIRRWQAAVNAFESNRRDRIIHVFRFLKGWSL